MLVLLHVGTFSSLNKYLECVLSVLCRPLKGTVAWDDFFAHCILSRIERKILNFFLGCSKIYWVSQDLTHLAHKENTLSDIFPVGQAKNFNCILLSWCSDIISRLPWLKSCYWPYGVLISCWKILAHFPNTLNAAKVRPKKIEILTLYPGYNGMVKNHLTLLSL